MKIVNHREFDKEYFEAKKKLYGTDIELIQEGDGIDTPNEGENCNSRSDDGF